MAVETTGSLTNTTATVPANPARRGLLIGNPSVSAMTVRFDGLTASATAGVPIPAGTALTLTPDMTGTGAVSLFCAGTGAAFTIYEW